MKFSEYYEKKIVVRGMPTLGHIANNCYDVIINVSDEFNDEIFDECLENGISYFWFPMNEHSVKGDIGVNSMYGALTILHKAYKKNAKVLLHCHAGANRSPTVKEAFYYMNCGKHVELKSDPKFIDSFSEMLQFDTEEAKELWKVENKKSDKNNRLVENCNRGNLPALPRMQVFLKELQINLNKNKRDLESLKINSFI